MPIFYRGAGPGTYWDSHDARLTGFTSQSPGMSATLNRLMQHVARGTVNSPYVSLTRSFSIAHYYATNTGRTVRLATAVNPGFVYEIELNDPLPPGLHLLDPIREVANNSSGPLSAVSYHHDGPRGFLLGVIEPERMKRYLKTNALQPPPGGGTPRPPNLTLELETLVRTLRDAEILALGAIPAVAVVSRYPIY
jgi:hypothetical protein